MAKDYRYKIPYSWINCNIWHIDTDKCHNALHQMYPSLNTLKMLAYYTSSPFPYVTYGEIYYDNGRFIIATILETENLKTANWHDVAEEEIKSIYDIPSDLHAENIFRSIEDIEPVEERLYWMLKGHDIK